MPSASRHTLRAAACSPSAACCWPAPARLHDDAGNGGAEAGRIQAHPRGARSSRRKQHDQDARPTEEREAMTAHPARRPQRQAATSPARSAARRWTPSSATASTARRGAATAPTRPRATSPTMSKRARRPAVRAAGQSRLGQPRGRGRLLRPAADRGRDRRRRRPQRLRQRRKRGAAGSAAQPGQRRVGQHRRRRDDAAANAAKGKKAKAGGQGLEQGRRQGRRQDQQRDGPPGDRLQADARRRSKKTPSWSKKTPNRSGANYIKAQQNLPDVIVVGGDPSEAPGGAGGAGEP